MDAFQEAVSSLLASYSKCLSTLKRFRRKDETEPQKELASVIRKAQSGVSSVYSSKLSQCGTSFEAGDDVSQSLLKRVTRRLMRALESLGVSLAKDPRHKIDYPSLISLCNASQSDAVQAMNELSSRIHLDSLPPMKTSNPAAPGVITRKSSKSRPAATRSTTSSKRKGSKKGKSSGSASRKHSRHQSRSTTRNSGAQRHRLSKLTMSSESTKLGEIRRQSADKLRHPVTYPYRQTSKETKKRRKKPKEDEKTSQQGSSRWWKVFV